ncbi:MAG: FHA domain-containing protein [Chloroflexota bacterium]
MYKYSCRKCPIRNRCIKESKYTTSVKNMIRSAFEVRTDTLATWGLLQANCLLIKAEEEQEQKAREESTLRRRLREAREARKEAADEARKKSNDTSPIRRLPQTRKPTQAEPPPSVSERSSQPPDYLQPVSPATSPFSNSHERPDVIGMSGAKTPDLPDTKEFLRKPAKSCWFTVKGTGRHIRLPLDGELVLGRFDVTFGIPPDIDLAFEDGENHTVSRRHARIIASEGYHTIEDTGSSLGLLINGTEINPGQRYQLKPGDRIALGGVQLFYDEIPEYLTEASRSESPRHTLAVTPTGRKIKISPPHDIVIGRSDQYVDFTPEIDLSPDGQVAARVSRRHAIIHWRNDEPYLEDLGSGFGTRVNGKLMLIGQAVALKPGDHIWLGGCVLAYDLEL